MSGRLNGGLARASSSDWFTVAPGGLLLPDVRLAIQTVDGAVVLIRYAGRLLFVPGQESVAFIAPVFVDGGDGDLRDVQPFRGWAEGRVGLSGS